MQTEQNETGELSLAELDAVSGGNVLEPVPSLVRMAIAFAQIVDSMVVTAMDNASWNAATNDFRSGK